MEKDPIGELERRKRELTDRWLAYKDASRRNALECGFWTALGGAAIAVDFAILGGLGTAIAVMSGASWLTYKREAGRIEKQLKEVDKSLDRLYEERAEWTRAHPPRSPELKEEFSPAAKRQIDALKARLEELEKQVDKVTTANNPNIDKPKFKPPAGPRP
jgi:hypothetical protein